MATEMSARSRFRRHIRRLRCGVFGHAPWGDETVSMDESGNLSYEDWCGRCDEPVGRR